MNAHASQDTLAIIAKSVSKTCTAYLTNIIMLVFICQVSISYVNNDLVLL